MSQKSKYDPKRDTVGKIYRDLQMTTKAEAIPIGDLSNDMMPGYREDLNEACRADPFNGLPYFITFHQKKDLMMPKALLRRVIFTKYRPWPEDDIDVYHYDPKTQELKFCWALPHWSEMDNVLMNPDQFDKIFVWMVKCWKSFDLRIFGFYEVKKGQWIPNLNWKDKSLKVC